jgi:hypothetical protein
MTGIGEAGGIGDVAEPAAPVVLEERVAVPDGGDVEIGVPVIVRVGERGAHPDAIGERHTGCGGDVLEAAAAQVAPQRVAADLRDEVNVQPPVAVDVGHGHPGAVVVVRGLVGLRRVAHHPVAIGDAAVGQAVGEAEVVEHREAAGRLALLRAERREPCRVRQLRRREAHDGPRCFAVGAAGGERRRREQRGAEQGQQDGQRLPHARTG